MKQIHARKETLKKFMHWPRKIHTREMLTKETQAAENFQKRPRPDYTLKGTDRLRPCLQKDLSQIMLCPRVLVIDLYIFDPMFDPVFSLWKPKIREAAY